MIKLLLCSILELIKESNATLALACSLMLAFSASSHAQVLLGSYTFTGQSLAATDANALDGVTFSNFDIGTGLGSLFDNGAGDFLRMSGDDGLADTTGKSFDADEVLSFTVTNNSGSPLELHSLTLDYKRNNVFTAGSSARVYSSVQGHDNLTADSITRVGPTEGGTDGSFITDTVDLTGAAAFEGGNVSAADFTIADGTSITFEFPWEDNSSSNTRWLDLDNFQVYAVPEPTTTGLALLGALGLMTRRRRRA